MSNITLNVIHTIDPASIEALRGLLHPPTLLPSQAAPSQNPPAISAPPAAPVQSAPPIQAPPAQPAPAAPVSIPTGVPAATTAPAPVQPTAPAAPAPAPVPTGAPAFTREQVSQAAALFASTDANRQAVYDLIQKFGAPSITAIREEQLGAFATELRAIGVKI